MKVGLGMNIICVAVNIIWLHSYGTYIFQLNTFPQWAVAANLGLWSLLLLMPENRQHYCNHDPSFNCNLLFEMADWDWIFIELQSTSTAPTFSNWISFSSGLMPSISAYDSSYDPPENHQHYCNHDRSFNCNLSFEMLDLDIVTLGKAIGLPSFWRPCLESNKIS